MSLPQFRTSRCRRGCADQLLAMSMTCIRWMQFRCLPVIAALLLLSGGAAEVQAWQNAPSETAESGPAPPAAGSPSPPADGMPQSPSTGDTVIVLDQDGRPVEIPLGPTWEEYLEFVRNRGQVSTDSLPDFYLARLQLSGTVSAQNSVASLDLEILVRVLAGDRAVDIPLGLTEATLRDHSYEGPGTLAFVPTDRNEGLACRLAGAGEHTLRLKVLVAVRKSSDTHRLQLTLPRCPQSELTLSVPGERIVLRGNTPGGRMESTEQKDGATVIRAFGLGRSLDLSWQELSARAEIRPEIAVTTYASAMLEPDGADVEAEQTIVASRGNFERLTVEIPPGFTLRSLTSATHPEIQYEQPEFPRVTIQFAGPTSGPVKLLWSLYSVTTTDRPQSPDETATDSAPDIGETVTFELQGFRVEEASRHEGFLRVGVPEGFRLGQSDVDTANRPRQLLPARLSTFQPEVIGRRSPVTDGLFQVWRILDPGFRSTFQLERIEPGFLAAPRFELRFSDRIVELVAAIDVRVYRGSLRRLDLLWPNFHEQQWRVEVAGSPVDIELQLPEEAAADGPADAAETNATDAPTQAARLGMLLTEARSRTHGNWTVELTCRAPIPEDTDAFPLSLPQVNVATERLRSPVLRVTNERNIESTLAAARGTVAHEVPDDAASSTEMLPANLQTRVWEIDSPEIHFDATVNVYDQLISVSPYATLRYDDDRFEVQQRLEYDVAYEPLSRLRVEIPVELTDEPVSRAEFWLRRPGQTQQQKLTPVGTGLQLGDTIERSLQLPEALWGRFSIICQYSVPTPDLLAPRGGSVADVPLIQSADAGAEATHVEIQAPVNIELRMLDDSWQPELSAGRFPAWFAPGSQRRVQIAGESSTGRASERFSVLRAELQTQLYLTGSRTRAAYQIEGDVSWLTLTFPTDCRLSTISAWWDGERLADSAIRQLSDSQRALRFDLEIDPERRSHLLQIEYQSQTTHEFGPLSSLTVQAPAFSSRVQLSEAIWEVTLPEDQYILVYPESWMPQMTWQRNWLLWYRRPAGEPLAVDWNRPGRSPLDQASEFSLAGSGTTIPYRFTAFGHQQPLVIQSMSRPAIVMTGTGLALTIGLILLRVPATRHVLTLLVLTFAVSVVGLWHLESLQLLAQPAVFGLLLAVIGTLIDSRARRKLRSSYIAYSSPSDFLVPGSSVLELMQEETRNSPRRTPDAAGA